MAARVVSVLLMAAGVVALGWSAAIVADGRLAQWQARRSFETVAPAPPPAFTGLDRPSSAPPADRPLSRGAPLAALFIPRIDLSVIVLNGSDSTTLRHGPGHVERTALPGQAGNVVIAGHRDTFFRPLRNIAVGDDVFLESSAGRLHYRVASTTIVDPRDLRVLASTSTSVLTLITCYPFDLFGSAPLRFIVRATLVGEPSDPVGALSPTVATGVRHPRSGEAPRDRTVDRIIRTPAVFDAPSVVRAAIDRFRVAYNARLARHADASTSPPLAFSKCAVSIEEDHAAAQCEAARTDIGITEGTVWHFSLERSGAEWTIREVSSW